VARRDRRRRRRLLRTLGGGDCDDARADVHPGADDIPGDGVDQNCEGGDAKVVAEVEPAARPPVRRARTGRRRAGARDGKVFGGNILIVTIDAFRADRLGVAGYRGRPGGR